MKYQSEIETPAVVIDEAIVLRNLEKAQSYFDKIGRHFRPHIKTHKIPEVAKMQLALGAVGINCQKLSEVEPFVAAGITDILLTYNIIGDLKLAKLAALAAKCDLKVTADSSACVAGYARTFANASTELNVLVEVDTGGGRCGVQSAEEALNLAKEIIAAPGLCFRGLMTYPSAYSEAKTEAFFKEALDLFKSEGIEIEILTSGGTPSLYQSHENSLATEHRAGTYIYCDRSLVKAGMCELSDCALTVMATVVSNPAEGRFIVDAGSKALSSDLLNQTDYGYVREYPAARITGLSEEHGTLQIESAGPQPKVGDILHIIPNHACVVSNLFDKVHYVKDGELVQTYQVAARGAVI